MTEIGRTYAPALIANAKAIESGDQDFQTEIDGRMWQQPTFPYQAKCLAALCDAYHTLTEDSRDRIDGLLAGTGCEALFASA